MANIPNTNSKLVWVKAMARGQCFPLDATEIWTALGDETNPTEGTARYYAKNDPTAYVGQTLKVIESNTVTVYVIGDANGTLIQLATGSGEIDPISIEVDSELSSESENPVQNKVINEALSKLQEQVSDHERDTTKTFEDLTLLVTNHVDAMNNPHVVTKEQIGLDNVDNTSDVNKPVSIATQEAINSHAFDINNPHMVDKVHVGLGNVNNTSDLNKPISKATQKAIDDLNNIDYLLIGFDTSWIIPKSAESQSIVDIAVVGSARVGHI